MLFPRALRLLLASTSAFVCLATPAASGATLPPDEVSALREIGKTLGKGDWNFSVDPCSGQSNWIVPNTTKDNTNAVTCDCSFDNNTVCHVVSIELKSQNLPGTLPPELTQLPFLQQIDLTRNYLNGTIPVEWGSMKLVNISLGGNRISGPLPKELGNISTLATLNLEYNQLTGTIPPELGNLSSIHRLCLSSNYFTGELPVELAKLTTLQDFRISDSHFVGSIPNYIQSWPHLTRLAIQASGLSGPIPSGIFNLTNLSDLRISDLNGSVDNVAPTIFAPPIKATKLTALILRNCSISGLLPDNLGSLKHLEVLDLSFNNFTGEIPTSFSDLSDTTYIYLTWNFLSGNVPEWMRNGNHIDLSYNNFTANLGDLCELTQTNLFASSSRGNTSGIVSCLRSIQCPRSSDSFHINCGGQEVKLENGTIYEEDTNSDGPSTFSHGSYWGFSSTGNFMDNNLTTNSYIQVINSSSIPGNNPDLYKNARLSPLSLTYYGFCLQNGSYTVNLHFAEIMFTDDTTYASLGRRFFDIFIQGKLVKKDFNIEDEAGGVNKPIVRSFPALVSDGTLDIRFYWAGKGTDAIPSMGVYGPLISAISVEADFPHGKRLSAGAIAGIVIAVLFIISEVILWWKFGCLQSKNSMKYDLRGLDLQIGSFTLRQIIAATNNFDAANKIGEGGFGSVYKGHLADGTIIAVKQLSSKSKQGNREFVNEIGMISAIQHPNLVKLYGCCVEGDQLLLVYEYMENNSLARALFGPEELQLELDWPTRHKISIGIARGLAYLHEESRLKIVHRDIKATNVLLDQNLNPKISDFGLAKLDEEENTHISNRIAGTFGYMAPEYAMRGYLTDKADVYSFGVVLLEIVSGRSNISINPKQDYFNLLDWANQLKEEGNLMEIIDPRLGSDYNEEEVIRALHIALLCTNFVPTERPNMSSVVNMLEKRIVDGGFVSEGRDSTRKNKIKALEISSENENQEQHVSKEVPFTASSSSATDLYPEILDSDYLLSRS